MTRTLSSILAVSLFLPLGNAQDGEVTHSNGYAVQGNVATTRAQYEAEMQSAVQEARRVKALKEAMAAYTQAPQVLTTPEQFLAANRPPAPTVRVEGSGPENSPARTSVDVPEFQQAEARPRSESLLSPETLAAVETPTRKVGLFERLKAKSRPVSAGEAMANPYLLEESLEESLEEPAPPATVSNASMPPPGDQEEVARVSVSEAERGTAATGGNLFGRLFGKRKGSVTNETTVEPPSFLPLVNGPEPSSTSELPTSGMEAPSTFSVGGELAMVSTAAEAIIEGVPMTLGAGTQVGILSRRGGEATIQLPDQRIGTIRASALSR